MIDLESAFRRGLSSYDVPRGDEELAHVADLGKCLFATWARRNGEPIVQKSAKTLARLQAGLRDEAWLVDRIANGLPREEGWQFHLSGSLDRDSEIIGHFDVELTRHRCRDCAEWCALVGDVWTCQTAGCDYVGRSQSRIDIDDADDVERCLFDVKTTEWKEEWVETGEFYADTGKPKKKRVRVPWPDAPGDLALLQAYGYAVRRPRNPDGSVIPFAIFQWCRSSHAAKLFGWYSAISNASTFERIARKHDDLVPKLLALTKIGSDPVDNGIATLTSSGSLAGFPSEKWECGYCWNAMCAQNVNPDNTVIPA